MRRIQSTTSLPRLPFAARETCRLERCRTAPVQDWKRSPAPFSTPGNDRGRDAPIEVATRGAIHGTVRAHGPGGGRVDAAVRGAHHASPRRAAGMRDEETESVHGAGFWVQGARWARARASQTPSFIKKRCAPELVAPPRTRNPEPRTLNLYISQ